ncbi:MAG: hypothetical protein HY914_04695 [Desulfomonile tiedjei]|nr:hypothetical protein [Desulfomonile tiedjei]
MIRSSKTPAIVGALTMVLAGILANGAAFGAGNITDVKVSPDLRRVVVSCDGPMSEQGTFTLDPPSRLVIDIPGIGPGDVEAKSGHGPGAGLGVEVSKGRSGARLTLDFRGAAVPEHKIQRLGNCLLVFLKPWTPTRVASTPKPAAVRPSARNALAKAPHQRLQRAVSTVAAGGLTVESAEVVNGTIVLKVASKDRPDQTFRINLGIDFDRLGFNEASIRPVRVETASSGAASRATGPVARSSHGEDGASPGHAEWLAPASVGKHQQ